jgi:hypothetical protein
LLTVPSAGWQKLPSTGLTDTDRPIAEPEVSPVAVLADLVAQGRQSDQQALSRVEAGLARGGEALARLGAQAGDQAHGEAGLGVG